MKPPIIVSESGDILIFKSISEAEAYLESPDVLDGLYVAYDSEGRMLKLETEAERYTKFLGLALVPVEKVTISLNETEPPRPEELRQVLIDFLMRLGRDLDSGWLAKATLPEVLAKTIEIAGFTR